MLNTPYYMHEIIQEVLYFLKKNIVNFHESNRLFIVTSYILYLVLIYREKYSLLMYTRNFHLQTNTKGITRYIFKNISNSNNMLTSDCEFIITVVIYKTTFTWNCKCCATWLPHKYERRYIVVLLNKANVIRLAF